MKKSYKYNRNYRDNFKSALQIDDLFYPDKTSNPYFIEPNDSHAFFDSSTSCFISLGSMENFEF